MNKEKAIKTAAIIYLIIGISYFVIAEGLFSTTNFILGFSIAFFNFIYLEKFTHKVTTKDSSGAKLIILISIIRYPLIGLLLFGIINWKNFEKIPFIAGLSAVVVGLLIIPFVGGERKNES